MTLKAIKFPKMDIGSQHNHSLRLNDNLVVGSLRGDRQSFSCEKDESTPIKYETHDLCGNRIITSEIFDSLDCDNIINNAEKYGLRKKDSYDKKTRQSDQLCIIDTDLAETIFNSLIDIVQKEFKDVKPCGLNVDDLWELQCVNPCIRINSYKAPSIGFLPHYDGAYSESDSVKSALSIVIYLNDNSKEKKDYYKGGKTIFYDKPHKIEVPGMTVDEEIKINQGLDHYEKLCIKPEKGKCIIFGQNVLHTSSKITKGIKYIIRTDVIYKKIQIDRSIGKSHPTIFDDFKYQKCVNYFKEAQMIELEGNLKRAGELYERNISIRKCRNFGSDVWLYVLQFLNTYEKLQFGLANKRFNAIMMSDRSVFWKDMYHRALDPKLYFFSKENTYVKIIKNKEISPVASYVPHHDHRRGIRNRFTYSRSIGRIFKKNPEPFMRVITMYTIFLSGTTGVKGDTYIAKYDPSTGSVLECGLTWLLSCAYYGKRCEGRMYLINSNQMSMEAEDNFEFRTDDEMVYTRYRKMDGWLQKEDDDLEHSTMTSSTSLSQFADDTRTYAKLCVANTKVCCTKNSNSDMDNHTLDEIFHHQVKDTDVKGDAECPHKIGYQVYAQKNQYEFFDGVRYESSDGVMLPKTPKSIPPITKNINHNVIKNNLLFDFSKHCIKFEKCQDSSHVQKKCYIALIDKLGIEPYFHAGCECDNIKDRHQLVKNISSSLYKNQYLDRIHIDVEFMRNGKISITTTYSCINSF
jgi:hypothetical protein